MAFIEIKNLKKSYWLGKVEFKAILGVDITIKQGEFVALVGPSGSGKSTLMHILGGLDTPSEGEIFVEGQSIFKLAEKGLSQFRAKKVGFVFQSFNLFPLLSAQQNIEFPMQFTDIPFSQWSNRALELLDLVELKEWAHHKPSEMSGGQQQRVSIARSMANKPKLILADEATGELDTKTSLAIMALFEKIRDETGATIVLVTHDPRMADLTERKITMVDGLVVSDEPTEHYLEKQKRAKKTEKKYKSEEKNEKVKVKPEKKVKKKKTTKSSSKKKVIKKEGKK